MATTRDRVHARTDRPVTGAPDRFTSGLYECRVTHQRFRPTRHRLRYGVWYLLADLEELPTLDREIPGFSYERAGVVSFFNRDHGPRDGSPLRPWIDARLAEAGIDLEGGAVRLLTFPRVFGYVFNPLTVWFCHGPDGELRALLYEVANTFGEWHHYLVPVTQGGRAVIRASFDKELFVSPFIDMASTYDFRTRVPDQRVAVLVRQTAPGGQQLVATLTGLAPCAHGWRVGAHAGTLSIGDDEGHGWDPLGGPEALVEGRSVSASWAPARTRPDGGRTLAPGGGHPVRTADRLHPAPPSHRGLGPLERGILSVVGGRVRVGRLAVDLPDGGRRVFTGKADGPHADVELRDARLLRRVATTGAIGLADGYIAGEYETDDLASFIELAALHVEPAHRARVPAALDRGGRALWRALGRGAAPRGPLQNIVQHYDLGNAFYALWLDPTMTYSSAVFARDEMTLEEAQREKYRRLAEATGVREGEHVVEIGSGWGGFACHLAAEVGASVTTLTVSREQAAYVQALVARRGLADRVEVRLEDFAEHRGTYDRAVSVEMIESIPSSRWEGYFGALRRLVRPGGTAGLQIITVADRHWDSSNRNPDFIRRYIFPGGQVPAPKVLHALTARHGFGWLHHEAYGASYARTLRCWRESFEAHWREIEALGFDEPFRRMWRYYLSYCEGGFRAGRVDVGQIVLTRS